MAICILLSALLFVLVGAHPAEAQIPSQNVNMVSGRNWPGGDPFLQRQNEPSIAVSTRNPLHLLAGANDYRTVDLAGLLNEGVTGDAWLGLFKSFDGGRTWKSTLLPGCPQNVIECADSPLKGFQAAADPTVRAGTNGLFYYSGIAFDRGSNAPSAVFVARLIDNNDLEAGDPIRYLGTSIIDRGDARQFIDKPWLAVDIPRAGASTCRIRSSLPQGEDEQESDAMDRDDHGEKDKDKHRDDGRGRREQSFLGGNVYVAYSVISGGSKKLRAKIMFSHSTDCGANWREPIALSDAQAVSQGATIGIDPHTGAVYVAWRQFAGGENGLREFASPGQKDAILIAKSVDGGKSFGKNYVVTTIDPFEQGATGVSFRTTNFPSIAVDQNGRVYLVWSQRGIGPGGDARIMLTSSGDGKLWTTPRPVSNPFSRGHQLMPSITFSGGKLIVVFYDLREDHTFALFTPGLDGSMFEARVPAGDLAPPSNPDKVFTPFIQDAAPLGLGTLQRRHTMDVRAAQADPGPFSTFVTRRVSEYMFGSRPGSSLIEQLQFSPPNLPLFKQGTLAFVGDYVDVTGAPVFVPAPGGGWRYNTSSKAPVFHAAWTDNRDVRPPSDGDWTHYTPPTFSGGGAMSLFDPSQTRPTCEEGQAGMRNQNIYTAQLTQGLFVGSPGNSKPLGTTLLPNGTVGLIQRGFAVFAQNTTDQARSFRFTIVNQPPGGKASFLQFSVAGFPDPLTIVDATTAPRSSVSRTVFVTSTDPRASVTVTVEEISGPGALAPIPGGLQDAVVLNPDISNPSISNPSISNPSISNPSILNAEVYDPSISNPSISNPSISNPSISNPSISNPSISNIVVANPDITNPSISNPDISNPSISNPSISNPSISNTDLVNGAYTDATWTITNNGNTAATYSVRLLLNRIAPQGFKFQAILHRSYETPVIQGCEVKLQTQSVVVASVADPKLSSGSTAGGTQAAKSLQQSTVRVAAPQAQQTSGLGSPADLLDPDPSNTTLTLAPGESAQLTLRILDPDRFDAVTFDPTTDVTPATIPQGVNTADALQGVTQPPIVLALTLTTFTLPDAITGVAYSQTMQSVGGIGPNTWSIISGSLPQGLNLIPATGGILGTPTSAGVSTFTAQVQDSSTPPLVSGHTLSIRVSDPLAITTTSLPGVSQGAVYSRTLTAAGGFGAFSWGLASGTLPPGLLLNSFTGDITGTVTTAGTFNFMVQAVDSSAPPQVTTRALSIQVNATGGATITFATQPSSTSAGQPITPAVQVQVLDATNAAVPGASVSLAIGANPSGGVLSGLAAQTTNASGIATFAGLSINNAGTGYTLVASLPAFPGPIAISAPFGVVGSSSSANMATPRANHTATKLLDGRVLIAGGASDSTFTTILASAEIFDSATGLFTPTGSMSTPRWFHSATLLPDGRVLIAGGVDDTTQYLVTAEIYDPATGQFTTTGSMSFAREEHSATLLNNGQVLIAGGFGGAVTPVLASAELFDPASGTFAITGSLNVQRAGHTATLLPDDRVLVAGGRTTLSSFTIASSAELYDPSNGTFTLTGSMTSPRFLHSATLLTNGTVLLAGGLPAFAVHQATAERFDPVNGSFTATGSMNTGRSRQTSTLLADGSVLIAGGRQTGATTFSSTELYDPVADSFAPSANMTVPRYDHTATLLNDGTALITGGANAGIPLASAEIFYPAPPALTIAPSVLPDATVGVPHSQTLTVTGGIAPHLWSVAGASPLPPGLTLSLGGLLHGTPTLAGTFAFTVQVVDSASSPNVALRSFVLIVRPPLVITTTSLPAATSGSAYSQTLAATGGIIPYTWNVVAGALPVGLTLNASAGLLSGAPTVSGAISFTVRVTDSDNPQRVATQAYALQIAAASSSVAQVSAAAIAPSLANKFGDVGLTTGIPEVSPAGHFVFRAGSSSSGLFLRRTTDAAPIRVLQMGDEVPGFPGSRADLLTPRINNNGAVAIVADFSLGTPKVPESIILLYNGSTFQQVAFSKDTAPGSAGLTFGRAFQIVGFNDSNDVAFIAPLRPSGNLTLPLKNTLYIAPAGGSPVRIVGPGDALPGTVGTVLSFSAIGMNNLGEVLFSAVLTGGAPNATGLYVGSAANGVRKVVTTGDAIPSGGTFSSFGTTTTSLNNSGQVAFTSNAAPASIFVHTPSTGFAPVASSGAAAPAALGGTFSTSLTLLAFNDAGQIAFNSNIAGSTVTANGLFRFTNGNPIEVVAYRNLAAPGTSQTFFNLFSSVTMNNAGQINFFNLLSAGAVRAGIFQQLPGGSVTSIALEGQPAPLPGGGSFSFASFALFRTLADGSVFLNSPVANGGAYAACWRLSPGGNTILVSTEDPLPLGSRVVVRTFGIRTAGNYYAYTAELAGGPASLWLHNIATGTDTRMIGTGDPSPLPGGGVITAINTLSPPVNSAGTVAFDVPILVNASTSRTALFVRDVNGTLSKIVADGDVDAATGRTFSGIVFDELVVRPLNDTGQVVFRASMQGTTAPLTLNGLFIGAAGTTPIKVALGGDSIPGGGTFPNTPTFNGGTMSNSGHVIFQGSFTGGPGIFINMSPGVPGSLQRVAAIGDAAPDGGTFSVLPNSFSLNDSGETAFMAPLGVYAWSSTTGLRAIALGGQAAPSGGNFSMTSLPNVLINNGGDVAFRAALTGGTSDSGYFIYRAATNQMETAVLQGQAAPDSNGVFATITGSLNGRAGESFDLDQNGELMLANTIQQGVNLNFGAYRYKNDHSLEKLSLRGDPVPGTSGGILSVGILQFNRVAANGRLSYAARLTGSPTIIDTVIITNRAPVAVAGAPLAATPGPVLLDGTLSFDPDGDAMTFEWRDAANNLFDTTSAVTVNLPLGVHTFNLFVTDPFGATGVATVTVNVTNALSIATPTLPPSVLGATYSQTLQFIGGTGSPQWTLTSGALPAGLSLNSSTGEISGIPIALGSFTFIVQLADAGLPGITDSRQFAITVTIGTPNPGGPQITTTSLEPAGTWWDYSTGISVTGGTAPYAWTLAAGSLPPGVFLVQSNGCVCGRPTAAGTYNFTVLVTDSNNPTGAAARSFSLIVLPGSTLTFVVQPSATQSGQIISPPVQVRVTDLTGTPIAGATVGVSLVWDLSAPLQAPSGMTGTSSRVTDVQGIATFDDLNVTGSGSYSLYATVSGALPGNQDSAQFPIIGFAPAGAMTSRRSGHTATRLLDGRVLLVGGQDGSPAIATATAELYDPVTHSFTATGSMTIRRQVHTATLLADGRVLITGGCAGSCVSATVTNTAEVYDPNTGIFTPVGNMSVRRFWHTAVALQNGKVLIAGGSDNGFSVDYDSAELFDPATGLFTPTGSMSRSFSEHSMEILADGRVLISGGYFGLPMATADIYNPSTGVWSPTGNMTTPRVDHTSVLLPNGKILVAGGFDQIFNILASTEIFDPASGSFAAGPSMSVARTFPTLTVLTSGKVLITGTPTELYDFTTNTLAPAAPLLVPRGSNTATLLFSGKALIAGGSIGAPDSAELYDPGDTALSILTASLFDRLVGDTHSETLWATGGTLPHTWSIAAGALPTGLTLDPITGVVDGVAVATGIFNFTVQVTDASPVPQVATPSFTVRVNSSSAFQGDRIFAITGTPFIQALFQFGGSGSYTWAILSGTLPAGVTFNAGTGTFSGTPVNNGTYSVVVQVTDTSPTPQVSVGTVSFLIERPLAIATTTLPSATSGVANSRQLVATGSILPHSWIMVTGGLPAGLTLSSAGVISGTTNQTGTFNFTVGVAGGSQFKTQALTLIVNPPMVLTTVSVPSGTVGVAYSFTFTATGGQTPYNWLRTSGTLPPGLTLTSTTGVLSGTPTTAGSFTFTIRARDVSSPANQVFATFTLVVNAAGPILSASPTSVDFGNVAVGSTGSQNVTLTNTGTASLIVTSAAMSGPGFSITGLALPLTLGVGQQTSFTARFAPGFAGAVAGNISIISTALNSPTVVSLSGNGVPPPSNAVFIAPPASTTAGQTMSAVQVQVIDTGFNVMPGASVTLSLGTNPSSTTLGGTLTQTTNASGVATFSNLTVNRGGSGFTLAAAAGSVNATSTPFNIVGFSPAGSMNQGRQGHTSTLLPDGRVLVAGGSGSLPGVILSSAEIYDPASGTFTPTGSMSVARNFGAAVLLPNGKVLIVGGFDPVVGGNSAQAELYDPVTSTFFSTGNMTTGRIVCTASVLSNGKVLIAGGTTLGTAELYDPATGTFAQTAGSMTTTRFYHSATLLPDGRILLSGGSLTSATSTFLNSAEIFDPATGLFTATSNMTSGRTAHTATLLPSGKVLVSAGQGPTTLGQASAELFDPATGTFTPTGNLSVGRRFPTATLVPSGAVLIVGGNGTSGDVASAELYDESTGVFTLTGSMSLPRIFHTAILLQNGKVLISPGRSGGVLPTTAELFHPSNPPFIAAAFTPVAALSSARRYHTATLLPTGKVLITGGDPANAVNGSSGAEVFDPVTSTLSATGSMSTPRAGHKAALLGSGFVLISGGRGSIGGILNSVELYNPATGAFAATGSMATARLEHTATRLPNGTVLISGGSGVSGSFVATAELYNPATGSFTSTGSLAASRWVHTATLLPNGKVLLAGGENSTGVLPSTELYDPSTGTFTSGPVMSTARRLHSATLLPNGRVLLAGGQGTGNVGLSSAEVYDPATNAISATGNMVLVSVDPRATLLPNGTVLSSSGFASPAAQIYDPATGTFALTSPHVAARRGNTATLLPNGKVFLAGGEDPTSAGTIVLNSTELYQPGQITQLPALSCSLEAPMQSFAGAATNVRFVNSSSATRKVYWLDFSGNRVLFATLTAGQSYVQGTFVTHPWVVTDASDTCQAIYLPIPELAPANLF